MKNEYNRMFNRYILEVVVDDVGNDCRYIGAEAPTMEELEAIITKEWGKKPRFVYSPIYPRPVGYPRHDRELAPCHDDDVVPLGTLDFWEQSSDLEVYGYHYNGQYTYRVFGISDKLNCLPADAILDHNATPEYEDHSMKTRGKPRNKYASDVKFAKIEKRFCNNKTERQSFKKQAKRMERRDVKREIAEQLHA
jgi:hypothetical protein